MSLPGCKVSTAIVFETCIYCKLNYCLKHAQFETHGCQSSAHSDKTRRPVIRNGIIFSSGVQIHTCVACVLFERHTHTLSLSFFIFLFERHTHTLFSAAALKKPSATERASLRKDLREKIDTAEEMRQTKAKPKKKK
jgi:hypothetical protein